MGPPDAETTEEGCDASEGTAGGVVQGSGDAVIGGAWSTGAMLVATLFTTEPLRDAGAIGTLGQVTVTRALEPVQGLRMIEVRGRDAGREAGEVTVWLLISDALYARLLRCTPVPPEGRTLPGLEYSDRSRMVIVVLCADRERSR